MDKQLDRISKLLRQAEKAGTPEEADAFMAKAQQLATATAIDLEVARQHVADKERRKVPTMRQVKIGEQGKRLLHTYVELFLAIARANDITCDIAHNSTYVYAFGFDTDIDVAEALYASLVVQMVEASNAYLHSGEFKAEKIWVPGGYRRTGKRYYNEWTDRYVQDTEYVEGRYKSTPTITARKSFQVAFARKVGQRLTEARGQAIAAAEAAEAELIIPVSGVPDAASTGTALVLRAKEVEVRDFYKATSRARGSYRGGRSSTSSGHARNAGREAGAKARLGGERAIGGGRRTITS
jgi:hypothetical protein